MSSPSASDEYSDDSDNEPILDQRPQYPIDHSKMSVVVDVRSMVGLPFENQEAGMMTLRAFIFPTGYFTNVENKPGKYVVSGKWRGQWALSRVHFQASMKRPSELFLGFVD